MKLNSFIGLTCALNVYMTYIYMLIEDYHMKKSDSNL